jgi:hypothetical protein
MLKHPSRLEERVDYTVLVKIVNGFGSFWARIDVSSEGSAKSKRRRYPAARVSAASVMERETTGERWRHESAKMAATGKRLREVRNSPAAQPV